MVVNSDSATVDVQQPVGTLLLRPSVDGATPPVRGGEGCMTIWTDLLETDFSVGTVDAGGVPIRSLRAGDGADVIFLRGTSGHLEAFTRNIAAHAARFRCHAIDMLGHGYTGKPDYPYEIPRYVEHLLAYMDAGGIERAHPALSGATPIPAV